MSNLMCEVCGRTQVDRDWISVKESMPPIGSTCLVYIPKSYLKIDVQCCYNNGRGGAIWADGWNEGQPYEITHWMRVELPKHS